jgi:uncharacterized protein (TIGR03435 family)
MRIAALLFAAFVCLAQPPAFDAVSVKTVNLASHPVFGNHGGPGTDDPGRIHLCCVGMYALLMRAYGVELDRIDGPSWILDNMGPNLYQVDATMPPGTAQAQYQAMLQAMLAERFHLALHRETRSFPGYELAVAKAGPKLKESAPGSDPHMTTSLGHGMTRVQAQGETLAVLVKAMGRLIVESQGGDPHDFESRKPRVIDRTGLIGTYDFTLEFACESCRGLGANLPVAGDSPAATEPASTLPNIFQALEKQLGLKLEKTHDIPLDVIVVDHVDKVPTEN